MMQGLNTALSEVAIALFTTLAPSGVFAIMLICGFLLGSEPDAGLRSRLNKFLCIPLALCLMGLVASATHLGNPSNALYVLMRVGYSPLSNEVFCAVVFLTLAGIYWLYSFARTPKAGVQKLWSVFVLLSGTAFITSIALAYSVETIIFWDTADVPVGLWLSAIMGGSVLALMFCDIFLIRFSFYMMHMTVSVGL